MNIFTLKDNNENVSDKINLDDLYETKRETDEMKLNLYNRILNRIHERIKITARQKKKEQFCWYVVPEIMVGVPKYDSHECTMYILQKLTDNGFQIKYTHPNLLFISWAHYYDKTKRMNIKKEYGVSIDGFGNVVSTKNKSKNMNIDEPGNLNNLMFANKKSSNLKIDNKPKKDYKQTATYKPTGNLIYSSGLLKTLQNSTN